MNSIPLNYERQYLDLCKKVITFGDNVQNRTGTSTYSMFGAMIECDLSEGFPLPTTKKVNPALPIGELLWMLSGKTDLPSLREYQNKPEGSKTIWSDDFDKYKKSSTVSGLDEEQLGRIYGYQLRNHVNLDEDYNIVVHDQLKTLIENIKAVKEDPSHPTARRLICTFWNPYDHTVGDKKTCALPACHTDFQCMVRDGKLNLRYSMRSNDLFLGQPFNEVFYATLCHILAKITGLKVGRLLYFGTDVHIYSNHVEQVKEQLGRKIKAMPRLVLPEFETLEDILSLTAKDFVVENYQPHSFIKAPQAS